MALCERVNSFSRKKITSIEKGCEGLVRLFSRSFFARISSGEVYNQLLPVGVTSPGLVFTTRGLGKNSPGLVKSNPGLVDATRRLVGGGRSGDMVFAALFPNCQVLGRKVWQ